MLLILEMGIPKFYGEWIRNKTTAVKDRYPGEKGISSISIDLNGIIHQAAQQVYGYGNFNNLAIQQMNASQDPATLYPNVYHKVTSEVVQLIKRYHPEMLVMAVDGVAPLAKINQQRQRRYLGYLERLVSGFSFDSSIISPGTSFMKGLDEHIRRFIISERKSLPRTVIYSSHLVPGEGEHKIMELMRDGKTYVGEGIHMLHGNDADLNMLALLSPISNIWIIREDNRGTNYIDIETLKLNVKEKLQSETAIEDFVVLAFFLGNDFLPHLITLHDVTDTLEVVTLNYKSIGKPLTVDGRLNFPVWKEMLKALSYSEPGSVSKLATQIIKHPHPAVASATEIKDGKSKTSYDSFANNWYYYNLAPKGDLPFVNKDAAIDQILLDSAEIIADMAKAYIQTVEYVYLYYAKGVAAINLDWYYPYSFAPLLKDIAAVEDLGDNDQLREMDPVHQFYHPIHQMLMIMSPSFASSLPYGLGYLMSSGSPIVDMYPIMVMTSRDGYDTDWQQDIYLPTLDPQRILDIVLIERIPSIESDFPRTEVMVNVDETIPKPTLPVNRNPSFRPSYGGNRATPRNNGSGSNAGRSTTTIPAVGSQIIRPMKRQ